MEVCKGQAAPFESDMAHPDPDTLLGVCGAGRPRAAAVEGIEHVGIRDAKVRDQTLLNAPAAWTRQGPDRRRAG